MSAKRKNMTSSEGSAINKRKAIDLEIKMKIIQEYEAGKKVKEIARDLELAHSTISTILRDKQRVKEAVKESSRFQTIITRQRKGLIHEMEKLLAIWFDDQIQRGIPITFLVIRARARSIFETLKAHQDEESTETFTASHGWFQRFCSRFNVYNRNTNEEPPSADVNAAETFIDEFDEIIQKGGYRPEQIFNVYELELFWKRMPERSYIHEEAKSMTGFKVFKDQVRLLLGGNVTGFKLKPLLIYRSENPVALKHVSKHTLPVYYRANKNAWMTQILFEDWFINCFIPSVKHYCLEKGVPFKIILLLDNASGHPQNIEDLHPDVKIIYLPKNTTAILQPMNQGAVATFKAYYLNMIFSKAVAATESNVVTLRDFWDSYNLLHCIKNIELAWERVPEKCMQGVWKKCLKRFANDFEEFDKDEHVEGINKKILELAKVLDLDIELEDIEELEEYIEEELTNEDLMELEAQQQLENEVKEEAMEDVQQKFTEKGLGSVFSKVNAAMLELEGMDPNVERFTKVERQMNRILRCYREIYEKKKKIKKQTRFFSKSTPSASTHKRMSSSIFSPPTVTSAPSTPPNNSVDSFGDDPLLGFGY